MGFWDWLINDASGRVQQQRVPGRPTAVKRNFFTGEVEDSGANFKPYLDAANNGVDLWSNRGDSSSTPGGGPVTIEGIKRLALDRIRGNRATNPSPPEVTSADILAQLEALQDPSRYMSDSGSLAAQARAAASAQYDPLISAIKGQMGAAKGRASRNSRSLGQMFTGLSSSLQGDVPEIQQMYATDKQEAQQSFDQLQQSIQGNYAKSAADQEEMLKRLNIEAAAPESMAQQQVDKDYFTQLAARDASVEQTALGTEERGAVNYTQQGSQIAKAEGTQRQADLMGQLSDLLTQYESQIGGYKAAKEQAYTSGLAELQNQMSESAVSRSQRDFDNYMNMVQLGRGLKKDQTEVGTKSVKSPADVAGRAMGMGLDQQGSQRIQDVFTSTISSDPQILAGVGIFGQAIPKEAMAQRIVEAGKKSGLNRAEINALQTIALEYFGRR